MVRGTIVLILIMLLAAPQAAAHGEDPDPGPGPPRPGPSEELPPWFATFEGDPWWGSLNPVHATSIPIRDLRARGDWAAWSEDGDIVALHIPTSQRLNVTRDAKIQTNPIVDSNRILYEQWDAGNTDLFLYDLDTLETRRLTNTPHGEKDPDFRGPWVVWLDDRSGTRQVWGMHLDNGTAFPVAISSARKSDLVLMDGGVVAWREVEHNQWDIGARRLPEGEVKLITRDRNIEHAPTTDGRSLYWTKVPPGGTNLALHRWDPSTGEVRMLGFRGVSTNPIVFLPGGVELTYTPVGPGLYSFLAINRSIDRLAIISEHFPSGPPAGSGPFVFLPARNQTHFILLKARVSDYATHRMPDISFARPLDGGVVGPGLIASGKFLRAEAWPEAVRLEYRLAGTSESARWKHFPVGANWSARVDLGNLTDRQPFRLQVRAVFDGAPSVEATVALTYRVFSSNAVDLETEVDVSIATFVAKNPGMVLMILLAVLLPVLLLARWRLRRTPRAVTRGEYVRPDE